MVKMWGWEGGGDHTLGGAQSEPMPWNLEGGGVVRWRRGTQGGDKREGCCHR